MSIHLNGLQPHLRDDVIEFPADVNGTRIHCSIERRVLERLSLKGTERDADPISRFKENWPKIRDVAYLKIQMGHATGKGLSLQAEDFEQWAREPK